MFSQNFSWTDLPEWDQSPARACPACFSTTNFRAQGASGKPYGLGGLGAKFLNVWVESKKLDEDAIICRKILVLSSPNFGTIITTQCYPSHNFQWANGLQTFLKQRLLGHTFSDGSPPNVACHEQHGILSQCDDIQPTHMSISKDSTRIITP